MPEIFYPELSYKIQGAFFTVYNELRHLDLSEEAWETALKIVLKEQSVPFLSQVSYEVLFKGHRVGIYRVDIVADDAVLVEVKAIPELVPLNHAQVISYLKVTGLPLGILVNFGGAELQWKRIPNYVSDKSSVSPSPDVDDPAGLLYPELSKEIRGAMYEVHRILGPGFIHHIYRRAMQVELVRRGLKCEYHKRFEAMFRNQVIESVDCRLLIIEDKILVAAIAVKEITEDMRKRFRSYLRRFDLKLGLIGNFHARSVEIQSFRR